MGHRVRFLLLWLVVFELDIMMWSNKCTAANRRYAIEFVSHWFYNIIGFGGRVLLHPPQNGHRRSLSLFVRRHQLIGASYV